VTEILKNEFNIKNFGRIVLYSSVLLQHLGLNACQALSTKSPPPFVKKSSEVQLDDIKKSFEILELYLKSPDGEEAALFSVVSLLRRLVSLSSYSCGNVDEELFQQIEEKLWSLLTKTSLAESIRKQSLLTLNEIFHKLNPSVEQRRSALNEMFDSAEKKAFVELLLASEIDWLETESLESLRSFEFNGLNKSILRALVEEANNLFKPDNLKRNWYHLPTQSVYLKYISVLIGKLCNKILSSKELEDNNNKPILNVLNDYYSFVYDNADVQLKYLLETVENLEKEFGLVTDEMKTSMKNLKAAIKSTFLGSILPTLVIVQNQLLKNYLMEPDAKAITNLLAHSSQLASKLQKYEEEVDLEANPISKQLELISPWNYAFPVETPHPVKDGYKSSETIQVVGAKRLVIYFDRKCATQNDFDKLTLLNGAGKKIGEFGGNPYGQGNKRQLGNGWPNKPVVMEGDSVIVNFEIKSRREPETMDKSVWGFRIHIGAVYADGQNKSKTSFFGQLTLSLVPIIRSILSPMFDGSPRTPEEVECESLLESKLLQRCIWKSTSSIETSELCSFFFPWEIMKKLKSLTTCKIPVLRSSLRSVICPEMLEEKILTVVIKHLGLSETVNNHAMWEQDNSSPEIFILSELVSEVYLKISSLIRRLQVLANLESQWRDEVSKMRQGDIEIKDVFFQDYLHHESKTKELALLCFLKGVRINENSQEQKIMQELKDIIEKESRSPEFKPERGTTTEAIVKGIFARLDLLLKVDISTGNSNGNGKPEEQAMTRSLQSWPEVTGEFRSFRRQMSEVERSLDDSILQIPKLQSRLNIFKGRKSALDALRRELHQETSSTKSNLLEQIFCFIGYRPEEAVSSKSFLKAVSIRRQRSLDRIEALKLMRGILQSAGSLAWAFVTPMADILQRGLRSEELTCGNMVGETSQEFSETISEIVKIIQLHPTQCIASIGFLCVIPYKRSEEKCLLQSQLVRCRFHLSFPQGNKLKKLDRFSKENKYFSYL
jgi:hypothetical protein